MNAGLLSLSVLLLASVAMAGVIHGYHGDSYDGGYGGYGDLGLSFDDHGHKEILVPIVKHVPVVKQVPVVKHVSVVKHVPVVKHLKVQVSHQADHHYDLGLDHLDFNDHHGYY